MSDVSYRISCRGEGTRHCSWRVDVLADGAVIGWLTRPCDSLDDWSKQEIVDYLLTLGFGRRDALDLASVLCDELKERGLVPH